MATRGLPQGSYMPPDDNTHNVKQEQEFPGSLAGSKNKSNSGVEPEDDQGSDSGPSNKARPVLTEQQKKANHISSEQKRREKIREQYDKLADLVPGMAGQGRSEARVLEEAARYGAVLKAERAHLIYNIEAHGGVVPPELKDY